MIRLGVIGVGYWGPNIIRNAVSNSKFQVVDPKYSGDSGAQIAWAGYLAFKQGIRIDIDKSYVVPKWRLDEIEWKRL